ncbi:uncharacterized protein isoform X3 [Rhodnius prolixus]
MCSCQMDLVLQDVDVDDVQCNGEHQHFSCRPASHIPRNTGLSTQHHQQSQLNRNRESFKPQFGYRKIKIIRRFIKNSPTKSNRIIFTNLKKVLYYIHNRPRIKKITD